MCFSKGRNYCLVLTALCCALLLGCDDSDAEEKNASTPIHKVEKCYDKPLIVEMGDYTIVTNKKHPREGAGITYRDKSTAHSLHIGERCKIEKVSDVVRLRWPHFGIKLDSAWPTKFDPNAHYLQQIEGVEPETLEHGVKKFRVGGREIYLLPKNSERTQNGDSVLINCGTTKFDGEFASTTNCSSVSTHSNGLRLLYRFFRKRHDEKTFYKLDQEMVQDMKSMIQSKSDEK